MLSTKSIGLFSSLREIEPEVWRRFVVPGSMSLHDLHEVLQVLYGWVDYHLYNFTLDDRYEKLRPDLDQHGALDSTDTVLEELLCEDQIFEYAYDFGDNWRADLEVEFIESPSGESIPRCVEGENAGPPEDVGGTWSYEKFLEKIQDPDHPEHEGACRWIRADHQVPFGRVWSYYGEKLSPPDEKEAGELAWDPTAFDNERINRDLGEIHWFYRKQLCEGSREYELTGLRVPDELKEMVLKLFRATDQFCGEHLEGDAEYARLFRRAAVKLSRKRPSPLKRGRFKNWVGGIIYGVGQVNYLFHPDEPIHLSASKISSQLEIPDSTLKQKAGRVREELDIDSFEPEWLRKDLIQRMPAFQKVEFEGEMKNVRWLDGEDYEKLREEGAIPDISQDRFPPDDVI